MNLDIRKHIQENFKGASNDEIKSSITEAIANKDEVTLPGLGVFLEILWQDSNEDERAYILNTLANHLK